MITNLNGKIENITQTLQASLSSNQQSFNVEIASGIIYAISPTAKIEELPNGNYLITITDKNGTTTAEISNLTQQTINYFMDEYFQKNPIIQNMIKEHNLSEQAHPDIRFLLTKALFEDDILILDAGNAQTEY